MKTVICLLTAAFWIICFTCWEVANALNEYVVSHLMGSAVPFVATPIVPFHAWLLLCPLPWTISAAVLAGRKDIGMDTVLKFAATMGLAAAVIICLVTVACLFRLSW